MLKSKRAKALIPKTAKDLDVSEELVTDVVDFYYTKLRRKMETLEDHRIGVPILGTFYASGPKIEKSITTLEKLIEDDGLVNFDKIRRRKANEDHLAKQKVLLSKIREYEQERKARKEDLE